MTAGRESKVDSVVGSVLPGGTDSRQKRRFRSLFFVQFIAGSGIMVFRNVYFEELGMSGVKMGVIGFLLLAVGVVVQPVWGALTDYWHAERAVLAVGALVSALALVSYPIGGTLAAPFLIVALGTVVFSAFRAPIVPVATGMVLSRGYDYGLVRGFGSLAFAVGSLAFGLIIATFGSVSIVYGYVISMLVLVVIVRSLADRPVETDVGVDGMEDTETEGGGISIVRAIGVLVTNREFVVVVTAMFLLRLSFMGGEAFLSVYMRAIDASLAVGPWTLSPDGVTGIAWAINGGIETIVFVYAARLRRSYRWLLVVGGVAIVLPNLVYGLTTRPVTILVAQVFGGVGFALLNLGAVNLVDAVATERVQSSAQTLLNGFGLGLGGATGQIVAGGLVDATGLQWMYVSLAVIGFVGAGVGLFVTHPGRISGDTTRS